eukprot:8336125-Pyramimonas_sp.AAC.1
MRPEACQSLPNRGVVIWPRAGEREVPKSRVFTMLGLQHPRLAGCPCGLTLAAVLKSPSSRFASSPPPRRIHPRRRMPRPPWKKRFKRAPVWTTAHCGRRSLMDLF